MAAGCKSSATYCLVLWAKFHSRNSIFTFLGSEDLIWYMEPPPPGANIWSPRRWELMIELEVKENVANRQQSA